MVRLLMHTGCRPGEIQNLRWEWVALGKRSIRMPRTSTKEKRAKTIFITEPMLDIFASLKRVDGNPHVICSERMDGKPIQTIAKAWKRICAAAKLEDLHLHDLRHSHAPAVQSTADMHEARNARGANSLGYSLPMIGALLGHSQYQTTLRYAHLADTQLRQAAEHISQAIAETQGRAGKVVPLKRR
jgi:integrase